MKTSAVIKTLFSLYNLGWAAAIPLMKRNPRISDGFAQRMMESDLPPKADIWIQSASAGEAYLTWEILKTLDFTEQITILTTANTRQGLDILEKAAAEINVLGDSLRVHARFSPFDQPVLMEKAVKSVNPSLMVLVELEIWPGLLKSLKYSDCHVLIVNGRLTERSLKRYLMVSSLWKLLAPASVCAMSDDDAARFRILFPESRVRTVPNIKFDRVPLCAGSEAHDEENPLNGLVEHGKPLIVLGSVREEEEEAVGNIIEKLATDLPEARIFLFPRHMHRLEAWAARLSAMGSDFALRSRITLERPQVVLWDVFGELTFAYKLAHAAFIGGSLAPLGGQNFLEALACGVIPVTGPSWTNFTWVGQGIVEKGLLDMGIDWNAVAEKLIRHAMNPMERIKVKTMTDEYLLPLRGGTEAVCREIKKMYSDSGQCGH